MAEGVLRPADLARRHRVILTIGVVLCAIALILVAMMSYRSALIANQVEAANRLALQVNGLVNSLEKYRLLTPLIARRPDILAVFASDRDDEDLEAALEAMTRIAGMSGATEIELTYPNGEHLSMLNGGIGANLSPADHLARDDIIQAREGRLGRKLMVTDQGRYYVFSSASRVGGALRGIVSIWVDLSQTEQIWALSAQPIFATERERVILTNQEIWSDRFVGEAFAGQSLEGSSQLDSSGLWLFHSLFGPLLIQNKDAGPDGNGVGDYVAARTTDPLLGWTFYALEPLRGAVLVAAIACVTALLFAGLLIGGLWVIFSRQQQQLSLRRKDVASALWLERRVRDRTRELRQTQEGLIHSAKLAAIGQMSAVLSHEYNQPLAAIRSYADNAQLLFQKGRVEQGQDNLARIGRLVDRLANLSKTLKTFARRPGVDTKPVSVEMVADEAILLMLPRARKNGVALELLCEQAGLHVMAGHTRLEQVLINLIANALDALVDRPGGGVTANETFLPSGKIQIRIYQKAGSGCIEVADNGPGIALELEKSIFEPFVTSKDRGVGLGLGLPIAYNLIKGFGGRLQLAVPQNPDMATAFDIALPLASNSET